MYWFCQHKKINCTFDGWWWSSFSWVGYEGPPPSDSSLIPGSCCSRPPLTTKMLQASQAAPNSCLSSQISFYQCFICIERDLHAKQYFGNILQLLLLKFLREAASRRPNWIISKPNENRFSMGILIILARCHSLPTEPKSSLCKVLLVHREERMVRRCYEEMSQLGERPSTFSPFHTVIESPTRLFGLFPILSADEGQNTELDLRTK